MAAILKTNKRTRYIKYLKEVSHNMWATLGVFQCLYLFFKIRAGVELSMCVYTQNRQMKGMCLGQTVITCFDIIHQCSLVFCDSLRDREPLFYSKQNK